jgi:hypothetical protein
LVSVLGDDVVHEVEELAAAAPGVWPAVSCPVAILNPANNVLVPWRLYS